MGQSQCCETDDSADLKVTEQFDGARRAPMPNEADALDAAEMAGSVGAASESQARTHRFFVTIDRSTGANMGARLDPSDGRTLFISSIERGDTLIQRHNETARKDPRCGQLVEGGQYIVEVNGRRDDAKSLEEQIMKSGQLAMVLVRPQLFKCVVQRRGLSLGLELRYPCNYGTSLLVETVLPDGAAALMTGEARPLANDRVVAVNGKVGSCNTLLEEIKKSTGVVELAISRLAPN